MTDDLIGRAEAQTAIQFAAKRYTVAHEAHGEGQVVWSDNLINVTDAMNVLRDLPSAQPEPEAVFEWKKEFKEYIESLDITRDEWKGIIEYINDVPTVQPDVIRCKDCVNYIDHRCVVADHHVSPFSCCQSVFGAKMKEGERE